MKALYTTASAILIFSAYTLWGFDYVHLYQPPLFFGEPRFERHGLTTAHATISHGYTRHARNGSSKTSSLGDLYGVQHLQHMGSGVSESPENLYQALLQQLAALPGSPHFAKLSLTGSAHLTQIMFDFTQNIVNGFFIRAQLPLQRIHVSHFKFTDLSLNDGPDSQQHNPIWQEVLRSFDNILSRYDITRDGYRIHGAGDLALTAGWSINYDDTGYYDYVDTTVQVGGLLSTTAPQNSNHILELPLGYNTHSGGFIIFEHAYGLYDWISFGLYFQALFFADAKLMQRIKTNEQQSGLILLQKECVQESRGNQYLLGLFFKADHFIRGLSLTAGYSYTRQQKYQWFLHDHNKNYTFNDQRLAGWSMQTVHLIADYDFADYCQPNLPIVGLTVNIPFYGKHILKTALLGGSIALNIGWNF